MDIKVSTETPPAHPGLPSDPVAVLTVDAVGAATHAEAVAEIVAEKVDEVAAVVESVADLSQHQTNELFEVKEWQSKTEGVLTTLLESQAKMMEQMEALALAVTALSIQPALLEQDEDGTPTIAPASDALPSDPAQALPVAQVEQALEKAVKRVWF